PFLLLILLLLLHSSCQPLRFPARSFSGLNCHPRPLRWVMSPERTETPTSGATLLDQLRRLDLLDAAHWEELGDAASAAKPADLARQLVDRGWLTDYQARELLEGRGAGLVLGQYHLLEPLGGGGMGQVFRAWHRLMRRAVALKVMRDDWMAR